MSNDRRITLCLLLLRAGVFFVMFMWTLDKFMHPQHAAAVYQAFYNLKGLGTAAMYLVAAAEMAIIIGFLVGYQKRWTYGAVLVLHAISTLASYKQYLAPFAPGNLMFVAAWPMLAASFTLYYLRDQDTRWSVDKGAR